MDQLEKKTLRVSRGFTYTYYTSPPSKSDFERPTLLLNHGFPDSAYLFQDVVPLLSGLPYRVLIPDLLGYAGTSKPTDPALYTKKAICDDVIEIVDAEKISKVVSIGHDWGSGVAQNICIFHPERVVAAIFMNVAYQPPQRTPFDLAATNTRLESIFGYPLLAFWELLTAADGADILDQHLDSFWTVLHGNRQGWMKDLFCVRGAMRDYLLADKRIPLQEFAEDPKWKTDFMERFKEGGFAAPLCWYKATARGYNYEVEKDIPAEDLIIKVPILFIGCTGDAVCRTDLANSAKNAGLVPDMTVKEIQTISHWCPMEKPTEVGHLMVEFLTERNF